MDDRLKRLKNLRDRLSEAISECESKRDLAALAKQYRETLKEIEEIEGGEHGEDEIEKLLNS